MTSPVVPRHGPAPPTGEVLLRARGITKSFPDEKGRPRTVLDGLDLEIHRQSLVVIRGESGCGKSTLLRILGLVDRDFEGRLEVCGTTVAGDGRRPPAAELEDLRARHIGFVFQDDLLLPLLDLRENSELPARIHHVPKARIRERLDRLQRLIFRPQELDEDDVMRRRRTQVSGGQRQRAAILRALSHRPDLILADEPTASLDPKLKAEVVKIFRQLCEAGATILVASHDSIFQGVGETYELKGKQAERVSDAVEKTSGDGAELTDLFASEPDRPPAALRRRGCPPGLQLSIALREARGNLLFTAMIVVAMAAGLFQLTLMWSIQAGTGQVLDEVINKGSRLDRIEIAAKARDDETTADGLPSEAVLAGLGSYRRAVPRREILLRVDDSRGRERQDTAYGLIPDDPELGKLELREGEPFAEQRASSLLISELSVERLFGLDAIGETTVGKRVPVRFRRYASDGSAELPSAEDEPKYDEITVDFAVGGVVDRAEAGRHFYLPSETLLAIVSWQLDPGASLTAVDGRLDLFPGKVGESPPWERLHVYFDRLDEVLPAAAYFERRGFSTTADLYRYKWILDTRRFVNWTIAGIVAMVLGIAGLLIVSNVVSSVRLKRKEIAVLKLMGMKDRDVVSIFVLSVLLCALLGGTAGFVGGGLTVDGIRAYLTSAYPDSPLGQILTSTWAQAPGALVLCVLVAVGFTALPAWHTARKEAVWTLD